MFKLLDYFISLLAGIGTYFLVDFVVGHEWGMFPAMFVGMLLGMMVLGVLIVSFCRLTTAFEIMPSGMIITMIVGMAVGMSKVMGGVCGESLFFSTLLFSLFVQLLIDLQNRKLKGEVVLEE